MLVYTDGVDLVVNPGQLWGERFCVIRHPSVSNVPERQNYINTRLEAVEGRCGYRPRCLLSQHGYIM